MKTAEKVGDYRILHEIGRGGMGIVYLALQESLGRNVALKVLPGLAAGNPQAVERFYREARAAAALSHPGIVQVHESGRQGDLHFIAMELVEGTNLGETISSFWRDQPPRTPAEDSEERTFHLDFMTPSESGLSGGDPEPAALENRRSSTRRGARDLRGLVDKVLQAARALAVAHDAGIVHRDVKPANLLVAIDGSVKVADFGLARCRDGAGLTATGEVLGTPSFASPEQIRGDLGAVDARTDVYALGVTLYQAITNQLPFEDDSIPRVIHRILNQEPPRPRRLNPALPRDLETICLKAMEKQPSRRYTDAGAFADDLQRYLRYEPILARPAGPLTRTMKRIRRHRGLTAACAIAIVALAAAASLFFRAEEESLGRRQLEARSLVARGMARSSLGDYTGALTGYSRALDVAPNAVEALVHRAAEYMAVGAMTPARADFERALSLDPAYPPLRLGHAFYQWLLGADPPPEFAIEDLGADPEELELDATGVLLERLGRHLGALEFFERARDLDRSRLTSLHGIGLCSYYLGRHREAREQYEVIRALLPQEMAPRLRLLQIMYQQAREAPSRDRRAAIAADARTLLAAFDESEGRSALARLAAAAVMVIEGADDATGRARVLEALSAAQATYEADARGGAALPEGIFLELLAQVMVAADPAAAERCATRSLILRPINRIAPLVLGELAESRGDPESALGHYRRAWRKMPDSPLALAPLLRLAAAGAPLSSEEHLDLARRTLASQPDDPVPLVRAALHLDASGHGAEARRAAELAELRLRGFADVAELAWCREALAPILDAASTR